MIPQLQFQGFFTACLALNSCIDRIAYHYLTGWLKLKLVKLNSRHTQKMKLFWRLGVGGGRRNLTQNNFYNVFWIKGSDTQWHILDLPLIPLRLYLDRSTITVRFSEHASKAWFSYIGKIPDDPAFCCSRPSQILPIRRENRRSSQKFGTRRENRNSPDHPWWSGIRVFISRKNPERSGNSQIPDR